MDDQQHAMDRRHIVAAMLHAAEHGAELLSICASVDGDSGATRAAVAEAFGLDSVQVDAVLSMQMRRFTPDAIRELRSELADLPRG